MSDSEKEGGYDISCSYAEGKAYGIDKRKSGISHKNPDENTYINNSISEE